ncbi:MAG: hypothetical protein AAB834_04600, partial [Patescibacteria group bacterium]
MPATGHDNLLDVAVEAFTEPTRVVIVGSIISDDRIRIVIPEGDVAGGGEGGDGGRHGRDPANDRVVDGAAGERRRVDRR